MFDREAIVDLPGESERIMDTDIKEEGVSK